MSGNQVTGRRRSISALVLWVAWLAPRTALYLQASSAIMAGTRSGSKWSAPGAAICWQPGILVAMSAAQRATIGYS